MTDLTDKCKKGELPEGWYYLKVNEELANHQVIAECVIDYALGLPSSYFYDFDEAKIEQVLAPVPSYEEWQASEKYNKHLEEVIKIYERKDKQATETSIAYDELLEENTKLKELLKRCKRHINASFPEIYRELLQEINQALGEDK